MRRSPFATLDVELHEASDGRIGAFLRLGAVEHPFPNESPGPDEVPFYAAIEPRGVGDVVQAIRRDWIPRLEQAFPKRFFKRVVVDVPTPLQRFPWEEWLSGEGCVVMRRIPEGWDPAAHPLRFPLRLALANPQGRPLDARTLFFADEQFDDLRRSAFGAQLVEYGEDLPDVLHLALDPSELGRQADRLSAELRGPGVTLLVLQVLDLGLGAGYELAARFSEHESAGLLCAVEPADSPFFPAFYRALLQEDRPIDEAMGLAQAIARRAHRGRSVPPFLAARSGGETALSRGRALRTRVNEIASRSGRRATAAGTEGAAKAGVEEPSRLDAVAASTLDVLAAASEQAFASYATQVYGGAELPLIPLTFERPTWARDGRATPEASLDAQRSLDAIEDATEAVEMLKARRDERVLARWTNASLTRDNHDVPPSDDIICGAQYELSVQIGRKRAGALGSVSFGKADEALRAYFQNADRLLLDVVIFALDDVTIARKHGTIDLPVFGESTVFQTSFTPRQSGPLHFRVCVFFGKALLQSFALSANVATKRRAPGTADAERRWTTELDYATTADFALLEATPQPDVTLFVNDTGSGTHWIGYYDGSALRGEVVSVPDMALRWAALQRQLETIEREDERAVNGHLDANPGADVYPLAPGDVRSFRAPALERLACKARKAYNAILPWDVRFVDSIARAGTITVARCHERAPAPPWAALYDYSLAADDDPKLCPRFLQQVTAGTDLLDDPRACRAQPECPLGDPEKAALTVCPFGFWGLRLVIDQPLAFAPKGHARKRSQGEVPRAEWIPDPVGTETRAAAPVHVPRAAGAKLRVKAGVDIRLSQWQSHHEAELRGVVDLGASGKGAEILRLIGSQAWDVFYFYCHGRKDKEDGEVALVVAYMEDGSPKVATIGDTKFDDLSRGVPRGLVFFNACNTATNAGSMNVILKSIVRLQLAAGVIGTETAVHESLARHASMAILRDLDVGRTLGAAFLSLRRDLFRKLNPLGLVYTFYAPAHYHFGPEPACAACKAPGSAAPSKAGARAPDTLEAGGARN